MRNRATPEATSSRSGRSRRPARGNSQVHGGPAQGTRRHGHSAICRRIEPELNRVSLARSAEARIHRPRSQLDRDRKAVRADPCEVQIRNRFEPKPATVSLVDGQVTVEFDEPQRAITPDRARLLLG
jgi:hypothetical protein